MLLAVLLLGMGTVACDEGEDDDDEGGYGVGDADEDARREGVEKGDDEAAEEGGEDDEDKPFVL